MGDIIKNKNMRSLKSSSMLINKKDLEDNLKKK